MKGNVIVSSKGLDLVNGLAASTDETAVMDWHIAQKQKVNWPLWLVWLITALLVIALVLLILYFIVKFIIFILKYILSALKSLIDAVTKRLKSLQGHSKVKIKINGSNVKQETEKKKREPKEKEEKLHPYLAKRQAILLSSAPVREKAVALYEAFQFYDFNLRSTPDYRERQFELLEPSLQSAFEDLWKKFYKAPKNNGRWSGEEKNSIWIPDDSYIPKNKSYSNKHNKPWWKIKQYYHFSGLQFD